MSEYKAHDMTLYCRPTGHWQPWGGWGVSQPGTSWRLYDGDRIVLRSDMVGGYNQNAEYGWGRDLAGRHTSGDGTGGLLMVRSNGITYLPRHDGQGNLWGFSGGYSRRLKAFGQVTFTAQNVPASVPIGLLAIAHGSKEYFGELGLYNYGRRFYDPKLGRFIGRDPIAEEGGMNLYRFVANNPVNWWDYLGMKYGDTIEDNKLIPFGYYDIGDGVNACPFGTAWRSFGLCEKDENAPKGPRSGARLMDRFTVETTPFPRLEFDDFLRLLPGPFPDLSPRLDGGLLGSGRPESGKPCEPKDEGLELQREVFDAINSTRFHRAFTVDTLSLEKHEIPWTDVTFANDPQTWAAFSVFKGFAVVQGGKLIGIDKALNSIAGIAAASLTTDVFNLQFRVTAESLVQREWFGTITTYLTWSGIRRVIDYQGSGESERVLISGQIEYRIQFLNGTVTSLPSASFPGLKGAKYYLEQTDQLPLYDTCL